MASALWIGEPAQVILLAPGQAKRMAMTEFVQGLRGGWRTVGAAIRAGIHEPYAYLRYDPANRTPVAGLDCIGARYLTIGPLIPALLLIREGGCEDMHAFMDRLFYYRCDADLAARHVAPLLEFAGASVERFAL